MKKIYVYVGQLRGWVLRMAKSVKGLLGERVRDNATIPVRSSQTPSPFGYSPLKRGECQQTRSVSCAQDDTNSKSECILNEVEPKETLLVRAERYLWERYELSLIHI